MSEQPNSLETYNIKKSKRHESKKRKLEALLNLLDDSIAPVRGKKKKESLDDSYKALKDQLKGYLKKPEEEPCFYLSHTGLKAEINLLLPIEKQAEVILPIFPEDIYQFLMKSTIGHMSPYQMKWASLEQPNRVEKCVIMVVEGLTFNDFLNHVNTTKIPSTFLKTVQFVSSNVPFVSEIGTFHQTTDNICSNSFSTTFPVLESNHVNKPTSEILTLKDVRIDNPESDTMKKNDFVKEPFKEQQINENVSINANLIVESNDQDNNHKTPVQFKNTSRLHLLLSPIQMAMENYPLPQSVFEYSKSNNYVFSKDSYQHVSADSPLFAIDCEMCQTSAHPSELTRIAVLNENLETVFQTFVKPPNEITNYLTKFSGITEDMLEDVTVTLSDVQMKLRELLPSDAIICGHSLNCDLHALQMIHPYVIDTSVIFNISGIRQKKDSLKYLTRAFLEETIQDSKAGHNPVEDAAATMKLVKLKLCEDQRFGDACFNEWNSNTLDKSDVTSNAKLTLQAQNEGFFAKLKRFKKSSCLVGTETTLKHYDRNILNDTVQMCIKSSDTKVLKKTMKQLKHCDFVASHLDFSSTSVSDAIKTLDESVEILYNECPQRTSFSLLISGFDGKKFEDFKKGLFLVQLKK